MTTFNLRKIQTVDTMEHPVKDLDGNPTGVVFTLAGPTHPVRKAADLAQRRKLLVAAKKTGKVDLGDPEEQDAASEKYIASAVLGWRGYAGDDGVEVPFSVEAVKALLSDPAMKWLLNQLDRELTNEANFTKRV